TLTTVSSTAVSFKSLESDMRKALTLITKSGNYYDDATGVIETADEKWEEIRRQSEGDSQQGYPLG
ncbi:hypothetical protein E4U24_007264, partial [Claviceps purpurea]